MGLHKIFKIVGIVLGLLGVVCMGALLSGNESAQDWLMYVGYLVLAVTVVMVLLFVLKGVFEGDIKKTLMSAGIFVAIIIVSYLLADGTPMALPDGAGMTSESGSKWVGTGLYTFYILAIVAVGLMVFSGFKKITNR
jgi:NADH:ubiquinone oxidoreductase subunit 6 (subunit J)